MISAKQTVCALTALIAVSSTPTRGATIDQTVDSLFVIASSGELKYRDSVEPAKEALAELGAAAVPRLVEKLTTPDARERLTVIRIIEKIGVPAVPHLRESLTRLDNALQLKRICWALGDLKQKGISAVAELMTAATNQDWQVREYAVRALGKVSDSVNTETRARIVQSLAVAFADSVGQVRKSAAWATGALRIEELAPELIVALDDSYYGARLNSSEALIRLGPVALDGLLIFLSHNPDSAAAGDLACMTLGMLGDLPSDTLNQRRQTELAGQLTSRSPLRRGAAALALGACSDYSLHGELANLRLTERDPYVIESLESALKQIAARAQATTEISQ